MIFRTLAAAAALCALAHAQTFDVASIKASAPQQAGMFMMRQRGGPGTPDPGQYSAEGFPLSRLLMRAYNVKSYQVTGPDWINTERFDVVAKVPPGTSEEQFRLMLQNLLTERFQLKTHKESKEAQIYALVVGKGGPRLKEAEKLDPAAESDKVPEPPKMGKDGMPQMPKGGRGMMMTVGPKGMRMQTARSTVAQLADMLANQVGRPVVDQTGLTGEYQYALDFSPEGLAMMKGMPMMGPPPAGGDGGPAESGPSLFTAVQEQLGLKLEPRKGPVDLIVVDSGSKNPTEN